MLKARVLNAQWPRLGVIAVVVATCHASSAAMGSHPSSEEHLQDDQAAPTIVQRLKSHKPPPEAAHLDSMLYQLTQAKDVEAFARQHQLSLVDGRVRVIIELREGHHLAEREGVIVESAYQNLVRALVPVGRLLPLAQTPEVAFIRLSHRPVPLAGPPDA